MNHDDQTPKLRIERVSRELAEVRYLTALQRLRTLGIDPLDVLASTCSCCVLDADDWGTPVQYAWDDFKTWRFLTGRSE